MPWSEGPLIRFNRLRKLVEFKGLDGVVVSGKKEVYYFTGFMSGGLILPTYLFYREGKVPVLFTGPTDEGLAEKSFGGEIVTYNNYGLDSRVVAYPGFVVNEAKELLKEYMAGAKNRCGLVEPSALIIPLDKERLRRFQDNRYFKRHHQYVDCKGPRRAGTD